MCTGLNFSTIINNQISTFVGRTMELGLFSFLYVFCVIFVGHKFSEKNIIDSDTYSGLSWTSIYKCMGISPIASHYLTDGINETGLYCGSFLFPSFAKYQVLTKHNEHKSLPAYALTLYILSTCNSVENVIKILPTINVTEGILDVLKASIPLHFYIVDKNGKSLIIEYINGILHIYKNDLGVCTNSPPYPYHKNNLNNYINLTNIQSDMKTVKIGSTIYKSIGQGTGSIGMPGSIYPADRFVKCALYNEWALIKKTNPENVLRSFNILKNFFIVEGIVYNKDGLIKYEKTDWTSVSDLQQCTYYWTTYYDNSIQSINIHKLHKKNKTIVYFNINKNVNNNYISKDFFM